MSKFLKILGAIFLVIIVAVGIWLAIAIPKVRELDKDAVAYIEANIPLVVEKWNPEDLKSRASPELLRQADIDQLPKIFEWMSSLGKLKKLETPVGNAGTGIYPGSKFYGTWGSYIANAEFEAGSAQIRVLLRKNGDDWQIMGFHVNSPALLPKDGNPSARANSAK